jgi:2-polyprenyl-3-methyl-5-hydroxy-6-metoxy-1,4-benzoquinol methylase
MSIHHIDEFYESISRANITSEIEAKESEISNRGLLYFVIREIQRVFGGRTVGKVVELGGGYGSNLYILKRYLRVTQAVSIDFVLPTVKLQGIEYWKGPVENLITNFDDGSVDLVLMMEVIEHLVDPDAVITQVYRILRNGGLLLITTPNLSSLSNRLALLAGYLPLGLEVSTKRSFGRNSKGGSVVGHLRVFTFQALLEFVKYYGFRVKKAYTLPEVRPPDGTLMTALLNAIERVSVHLHKTLGFRILALLEKVA